MQAEKRSGSPWIAIFKREYRVQLVLAIALPFFQMATGINAVVFFSPQLFGGIGSFGEGAKGGLIASAVIGTVQVTIHGIYHCCCGHDILCRLGVLQHLALVTHKSAQQGCSACPPCQLMHDMCSKA